MDIKEYLLDFAIKCSEIIKDNDDYRGAIGDWRANDDYINAFFGEQRQAITKNEEESQETINTLLQLLKEINTEKEMIVYRNIHNVIDNFEKDDILTAHHRFTSTSIDPNIIDEFGSNHMIVIIPINTNCAYIDFMMNYFEGRGIPEILLPPGIFKCISRENNTFKFLFTQDPTVLKS